MKIITWNVNGIRAVAKKGFSEFVLEHEADIYCLQEVKAFESQFLLEVGYIKGYNFLWHTGERPGYAGTAILYREDLDIVETKNIFDEEDFMGEGRLTQIEFKSNSRNIVLLNFYFPNGGVRADGTEMLSFKLKFYDTVIKYVNNIRYMNIKVKAYKDIIITGDLNICHEEIDIARPKENVNSIGFLPVGKG